MNAIFREEERQKEHHPRSKNTTVLVLPGERSLTSTQLHVLPESPSEMEDIEPSLAEVARQLGVTSSAIYKALQKRDSEKFQ
jgi:hypothetical protein